jgi:hypothetical protein
MIPYLCALAGGPLTSFPSRLRLESCYASFAVFWLSPWRLARWRFGPRVIWSHVHRMSWLLPGFMIFFQSACWTYPESLLFSVYFLRKQWTPKSTCKSELVIYGGLVPVVRIIINTNIEGKLIASLTEIHRQHPALVPESSRSFPFCMWALVVSFSPSWTKLLVLQDSALFRLGPRSLSSSRVGSLGSWSHVHFIAWLVPGFKVLSWGA